VKLNFVILLVKKMLALKYTLCKYSIMQFSFFFFNLAFHTALGSYKRNQLEQLDKIFH